MTDRAWPSGEGAALVLELGAGSNPTPGALHHDRTVHDSYIDVAHDLNELPWPWASDRWREVWAFDVFEHLDLEVAEWLDECWRILTPGGLLKMRLPAWDNETSYCDPTHQRVFTPHTFDYWDPTTILYRNFGRYYFDTGRWWSVADVFRHEDADAGQGDLRFDLRKIA